MLKVLLGKYNNIVNVYPEKVYFKSDLMKILTEMTIILSSLNIIQILFSMINYYHFFVQEIFPSQPV